MATRFYGMANVSPPITPNPDAAWQSTSGFVRRKMRTAGGAGKVAATETRTGIAITSGANNETLAFQLISEPLVGAQTISGTVTIMLRANEQNAQDNIGARARGIRVVSGDGTTVRGTLLAQGFHSVTTELGTQLRGYPAASTTALSSVSAQDGDRIVVEIGLGMTTTGTTPLYDISIGGNGTDHSVAEADNVGSVPWIEFSQNLTLDEPVDLAGLGVAQAQTIGPIQFPAMTAQFDAQAITGLTDGQAVSSWTDDSGGPASNLTQGTAGNQPTYRTNAINGNPAVRLAKSRNDFMKATGTLAAAQPFSVVLVLRFTGTPETQAQVVLDGNDAAGRYVINTNLGEWRIRSGAGAVDFITSSGATLDTNPHIVRALFNGTGSKLWVDDVEVISGTTDTAGAVGLTVGVWTDATADGADADYGEIRVYNYDISSQWSTIRSDLETKWDFTGGAVDLTGLGVAQGQAATLTGMTQVHELVGLGVTQPQAATGPTLGVVHNLAGLGVAQSQKTQRLPLLPFLDPFTGANGSPVDEVWAKYHRNGQGVDPNTPTIQSNRAQFLKTDGNGTTVAYLPAWSIADTDSSFLFEYKTGQERDYALIARYNGGTFGSGGNGNAYLAVYNSLLGTGCFALAKIVNGIETVIAQSTAFDGMAAGDYKMQLRVVGNQLRARMWLASGSPGAWQLNLVDSSVTSAGHNGIFAYRDNGLDSTFDDYTLNTAVEPTLTGLGVAQAQTTTNISFAEPHVLAGLGVAQAQSVPNVLLHVISPLVGLGVAQAQATADPTLTQVHVLSGLGVGQIQRMAAAGWPPGWEGDWGEIELVQNVNLTGLGVAQPQSVPNVVLTLPSQAINVRPVMIRMVSGRLFQVTTVIQVQPVPPVTTVPMLANMGVAQAQTTTNIVLVQQHTLAGLGVAQGQTTTNIALVQQHVLAGLGVAQAQTTTSPTLAVAHNLAGLNVAQAQSVPNVLLGLPGQLTIPGVAQGQSSTVIALTQLHVLAGLNVAQAQATADPTLAVIHNLAGLNVAHPQAATGPALAVIHHLLGLNVAQAQAIVGPTLAVIHNLLGLNVAHPQAAQQVPLGTSLQNMGVAQGQKTRTGVDAAVALTQLHILAGLLVAQAQVAGPLTLQTQGTLGGLNVAQAQATADPTLERMFNLLGLSVAQTQSIPNRVLGFGLMGLGVAQPTMATVLVLIQVHFLAGLGVLSPQQVTMIELGVGALPLRRAGTGRLAGGRGGGGLADNTGSGGLVGRRGGGGQ